MSENKEFSTQVFLSLIQPMNGVSTQPTNINFTNPGIGHLTPSQFQETIIC